MEEARPFPKMSSPPDSVSSTPSLELGGLGPDHGLMEDEDRHQSQDSLSPVTEPGVHPGARVFNWTSPSFYNKSEETATQAEGPVSLTNMTQLTPISPSNEDVHSSEQYRHQPQPSLVKYTGISNFPGVWGYHHPLQTFQPTVFTMEGSEKYRKMMLKKHKKASKKEKNVMNVMKAEDVDGHNADFDINSVLESIGEKVDEEKKPKKKAKEKVDKSKTKKEKKKSPNQSENDEQLVEEQQQEVEEDEEIPVKVHSKGVRNQFVEDELKSFKDNFYLIEPDQSKVKENSRAVEDSFPASPQASFTQVKSKKNRVKKAREEETSPPPQEAVQRRYNTASWSSVADVERNERREVRAVSASEVTDSVTEKTSASEPPAPAAPPPNLVNDFPALPGGGKKISISPSNKSPDETQAQSLPCAWSKVVVNASDNAVDNTGANNDHEANHQDFGSEDNDKTITVINECDEIQAVIDINVPKESEEKEDSDDADTVVSDVTPNCDEDVATNQVEVITTEDEFERKEVNKESPVVIFSENTQDWTSSEFSFGFEVNEDLVATAATAQDKMEYMAESQPQAGPVQFWPGALDTLDNAILSFGAAGPVPMAGPQDPSMRPLIVGVPVGVPFPVPGYYPHQMLPGAPVPPYPQVYNIPFPHQVTAEEDHEIMAEKNLEDHTISPESGISSSSPLSWQPDSSPSLPATASQSHLPLASQVSQSLSQWSGHASDHEDSEAPGWATQVEAEVDTSRGKSRVTTQPPVKGENQLKKTEKFNHGEIVNFISNSWTNVSEDDNVQVFRVKAN